VSYGYAARRCSAEPVRRGLGYESLGQEVSDSITWRRFCRIRLDMPAAAPIPVSASVDLPQFDRTKARAQPSDGLQRISCGPAHGGRAVARSEAAGMARHHPVGALRPPPLMTLLSVTVSGRGSCCSSLSATVQP
jgi:hypothetical protein